MARVTRTFVFASSLMALAVIATATVLSRDSNGRENEQAIGRVTAETSSVSISGRALSYFDRLAWTLRQRRGGGRGRRAAGAVFGGGRRRRGSGDDDENEDETPIPNAEEPACFPRDATVELENGAIVRMDALQIGDRVLVHVHPETMHKSFSPVHMFTHRNPTDTSSYVAIRTSTNHSLVVTPGHFIYAASSKSGRPNLVAAKDVSVGDLLFVWNESTGTTTSAKVTGLETVVGSDGRYNPQTVHGDIYVDGVRSSTYTTAIAPSVAHRALAPARWVYGMFGVDVSMGLLEGGMPTVSL